MVYSLKHVLGLNTALHMASANGHLEIVTYLVENGGVSVSSCPATYSDVLLGCIALCALDGCWVLHYSEQYKFLLTIASK